MESRSDWRKTMVGDRGLVDVAAIGAIPVAERVVVSATFVWAWFGFTLWTVRFPAHLLVVLRHGILASHCDNLVH